MVVQVIVPVMLCAWTLETLNLNVKDVTECTEIFMAFFNISTNRLLMLSFSAVLWSLQLKKGVSNNLGNNQLTWK